MSTTPSLIQCRHLHKKFNQQTIISDFTIDIQKGEFIVIVGPSGCGKSTLLRMIAGLEEIESGQLYIKNALANDLAPKERGLAMVFQNYALYPHMTVFNNIAYNLKLAKMSKAQIESSVHDVAELLKITPLLHKKPAKLSGGQRQRVAMGRAIVRHPDIFLFDEPLSNLDAKLREEMRVEIIRLHKKLGTTSVYVTHDQVEAITMADRVIIMNGGKIEQIGTPKQIYQQPESLFSAEFIGTPSMNFLTLSVENNCAYIANQKIQLLEQTNTPEIIVGIRPEHLKIATEHQQEDFTLTVDHADFLGSEYYIYGTCNLPSKPQIIIKAPQLQSTLQATLPIIFEENCLHVFSPILKNRLAFSLV